MDDEVQRWFTPVKGNEPILIGRESPLRRIPLNVEPKQAFFFDGLRHAVEIIDVAFGRLRNTLTVLAHEPPKRDELPVISAGVFLDAWAMVDSMDKFRMLYAGIPKLKPAQPRPDVQPLREALDIIRKLRNVADHPSQRADFVVSKNGAALGELTWLTGIRLEPTVDAWHCTLRPGTLRSEPKAPTEGIETTLDWPTDYICLTAGGFRANLSTVRVHVAARVRHLEWQLEKLFSTSEFENVDIFNDLYNRRPVRKRLG